MAQLRKGSEKRDAREACAAAGKWPAAAGRQRYLTGTILHLLGERSVRGPFRVPQSRRRVHRRDQAKPESETVLDFKLEGEEGPEEITSLHLDLAVPALEEFALSLDPYPRRPGVEFSPKKGESDPPESPFAVLKGLK